MQPENLIENLISDHNAVKKLLDNVFDYIINNEKRLEFVNKLTNMLAEHIEKEDKYLYPFLYEEAENDMTLKSKLNFFAEHWHETSEFFNNYVKKYSQGKFDKNFPNDTAKLISTLRQRMMKEEISLYPEYNKRL